MKSTKRILSAILSVVMILGCLTVGFTAQASASDLVAAVAAGGDVNWTGGNVTLADTLVIKGDVNVDFNGAVITGPAGKVAIRVDGGNVRLYDGVVLADQGSFSGETQFIKALMNYKPAISINDGNVELNCMTAVGSLLRIPNSGTIEVPVGNGINANGGNVTIDNVIAIGMKALDNTNAKVVVKDAILAGIYKAVNIYNKVDFGKDYVQYETVEILEGLLKDGVNLSANEKKYIASATNSQGDFSALSVIVNVAKPEFVEPATTFVNGKLNIIADVEAHEEKGVSNRYSYSYTPDYAVIGDEKVAFAADGAQYVASFDAEAGKEYDVTVNYDLSIKLGKKQKEIVEKAYEILEHYVDRAPELLNRFVEDFEHIYKTAENLVAYVYNAYADGTLKSIKGIKDIMALVYAVEGQEFNGIATDGKEAIKNDALVGVYATLASGWSGSYADVEYYAEYFVEQDHISKVNNYGAIFDTDDVDGADSVFAYFNNDTFDKTATFNESDFAKGKPGYGAGVGLLDVFNEYYNGVLDALYVEGSTTEFAENGVENAAAYIGYNWEGIYELVENAVVVLDKANELLDSGVFENILNKIGKSSFASYIGAFDTVYKYVNKIMDRADEALDSNFVATYLKDADTAAKYCGRYAKKVWDIANNPTKYFGEIPVSGDYVVVDLADDDLNAEFKVKAEDKIKAVNVQVQVVGMGSAFVGDIEVNNVYSDEIWFDINEEIKVVPVADETYGYKFSYMTVNSGGNSLVVDGDTYTTKAATNLVITVVFAPEESDFVDVVFMTDKALNYKYIYGGEFYEGGEWDALADNAVAPKFEGLTERGWSFDKNATSGKALADFADEVQAAAEAGKDMLILYAIYEYDEFTNVDEHGQTVMFTEKTPYSDGERVYFELSIQLRDTTKKALEAGVILTTIDDAAAMTVDKSGADGYVFSRTNLKDADGYVLADALHTVGVKSSKTVYARGYVVWDDGTVTYTTDVVSGTVA